MTSFGWNRFPVLPIVLIILAIVGIFSCNTKPTETPALETKISGKVVDKDNNSGIAGALVTTSPTSSSVSTDESGNFTISDVEAGQYVVSASKSGYTSSSISVTVTEGKTASADMQMETVRAGLSVSVPSLDFGSNQATATFVLGNATSVGTINYSISKSVEWLSLSSTSGTITTGTATITVTASRTNLSYGNYSTTLSVTSNGGNKDINVTMTVANPNAPQLTVSPLLVDFGTNLTQLPFTIRNSGTGKVDWIASSAQQWISISPKSDSARAEIDQVVVTVNRNSLPPTDYTGEILVASNAGTQTVTVKMNVPSVPSLSLSAQTLDFDSTKTQLSFIVNNGGTGSLNWNATSNQSWMSLTPKTGTNSGTVNVTIDKSGLSAGSYSGTVSLTSNGGNASIPVNMKVTPPPAPQAVTAAAGAVTTSSITISWTASNASDFAAYKVYYSTSAAVSENSTLATTILNKTTTSHTITGLTANTIYYFRVFVSNSSQQTSGSNTATAKTDKTLPSWQQVALPANFQVQSMHYIAENNIWVAGYSTISGYNFPRIYQFTGSQWVQSNIQGQDSVGYLNAIAFRGNTDGWAASNNRIYKFDGSKWIVQSYLSPNSYIISDALGTTSDIWFYGKKDHHPIAYRWNGSEFTETVFYTTGESTIDMDFNSNNGFMIDNYGNANMFNGLGWIDLGNISSWGAYTISGTSKNDIWAAEGWRSVGPKSLYHYDGSTWKRLNDIGGTGIDYQISNIRMISSTEGWASTASIYNSDTGQYTYLIYQYNGASWNKVGSVSGELKGVKNFGNGILWGIIYGFSGNSNKLMRLQ